MQKIIPEESILIPGEAQRVFDGIIFDVYQWQQTIFNGSKETFEMLKRADTATAICVVDGKILVIDDAQPHSGSRQSFPGGRVDDTDQDILSAAQREIKEETGYSFNNWRLIDVRQPYHKIEWFVYLYLAWDESGNQPVELDSGEKIIVDKLDFDKTKELAINGAGYLRESATIFEKYNSLDGLMEIAEFTGIQVDR